MELVIFENGLLRRDCYASSLAETLAVRLRLRVLLIMPGMIQHSDRVMLTVRRRCRVVGGLHVGHRLESLIAAGKLLSGQASIGHAQADTEQPHQHDPKGPAAELLRAAEHEGADPESLQSMHAAAGRWFEDRQGSDRAVPCIRGRAFADSDIISAG